MLTFICTVIRLCHYSMYDSIMIVSTWGGVNTDATISGELTVRGLQITHVHLHILPLFRIVAALRPERGCEDSHYNRTENKKRASENGSDYG